MKICLITVSIIGWGGVEALVPMLAGRLSRAGHTVTVISFDSQKEAEYEHFEHILISDPIMEMYARRHDHGRFYHAYGQIRCWRNPRVLGNLTSVLENLEPDIIHTHKIRGLPLNLWAVIRKHFSGKLIHTCHDIELLSPIGDIPIARSSLLIRSLAYLWASLSRKASNVVDETIFPSSFLMNLHKENKLFQGGILSVVPNIPILSDTCKALALVESSSTMPLKVLFMGRLVVEKGILLLCEIVVALNEIGMNADLRIAGTGPLLTEIKMLCNNHRCLEYAGKVDGIAKWQLYQWVELTCVPSAIDESFGLVAAESIVAGRPVLASSRGALPEVVEHGVTGWIYPDSDTESLQRGLEMIMNQRSLLAQFSTNCLLKDRFNPTVFDSRIMEIYQRKKAITG